MSHRKTLEHKLQVWFQTGRSRCVVSVQHVPTEIRRFVFFREENLANKEGVMWREIITLNEHRQVVNRTSEKVPIHNFTINTGLFDMLISEMNKKINKI